MNKKAEEAANEQYRNKFVLNQRGGSMEIDNTTGQEGIYLTQYNGNNIKLLPDVISEYATNNKQTLNDSKRNKGVHAKTKHSWNKNSKNYVKPYKGQGR